LPASDSAFGGNFKKEEKEDLFSLSRFSTTKFKV